MVVLVKVVVLVVAVVLELVEVVVLMVMLMVVVVILVDSGGTYSGICSDSPSLIRNHQAAAPAIAA